MDPLLHSIQITTLATWLSVAGFGTVGVCIHSRFPLSQTSARDQETELLPEEITLGDDVSEPAGEPASEPISVAPLPAPPELPELAEIEPLPEIPAFPTSRATPVAAAPAANAAPRAVSPARNPSASSGRPAVSAQRGSGAAAAGGGGMSDSARIAAGHMPSPSYPPYSQRNNQEGTVVVEFTVDGSGKVISAYAKKPSQWPLLNAEAVGAVRQWRFPPGGVMTKRKPIVFELR